MNCFSKLSILSVPDEGYSRNASCTLNLISTFLLHPDLFDLKMEMKRWILKNFQYTIYFWYQINLFFSKNIFNIWIKIVHCTIKILYLVLAISTGIDAAVVIKPLIILAQKCRNKLSPKYPVKYIIYIDEEMNHIL